MIRAWTDLLEDPDKLNDLYLNTPELSNFELAEVLISADEQGLMIRGTFSNFPEARMPDWEDDANRLGVHLWLDHLQSFSVKGWSSALLVDLDILYHPGKGLIDCTILSKEENFSLQAQGRELRVEKIFAYRTEPVE